MLLAEVLRDHRTGSELLRKFGTRAAYERIAVTLVMQALGHPSDPNARPYNDEMIVAKLVNRLYTACFPLSRGYLLENLSKHLAIYPEINKAIARKLEETGSIFVHRHASAIRSYLIAKSDGNSLPEMQSNALPSLFGADR